MWWEFPIRHRIFEAITSVTLTVCLLLQILTYAAYQSILRIYLHKLIYHRTWKCKNSCFTIPCISVKLREVEISKHQKCCASVAGRLGDRRTSVGKNKKVNIRKEDVSYGCVPINNNNNLQATSKWCESKSWKMIGKFKNGPLLWNDRR